MKDKVFFDTNMFIYLYSADEDAKRTVAEDLINRVTPVASIQVLNEISNILSKKFQKDFDEIKGVVDEITECCMIEIVDEQTVRLALSIAKRYKYAYYDCLIIASALESHCDILCTEDMQNGQLIENKIKIVNPFLEYGL